MFLLSFVLVLAAAGLLIGGLGQGSPELIWGSIAASILAAIVLVVLVTGRRRTASQKRPVGPQMQNPTKSSARAVASYDDDDDDRTPSPSESGGGLTVRLGGGKPRAPELTQDELDAQVAALEAELDAEPAASASRSESAAEESFPDDYADADLDTPVTAAHDDDDAGNDDERADGRGYEDTREDDHETDRALGDCEDLSTADAKRSAQDAAAADPAPMSVSGFDLSALAAAAAYVGPGSLDANSALAGDNDDIEPDRELADGEDSALIGSLDQDVFVIDGRPRYHLFTCGFLRGRDGLPISVREAHQDGFSPCAICTPVAVVAAAERRRRDRVANTASTGASAPKMS